MSAAEEPDLGRIGYEAYAASTGGKTYDGRPMPTWGAVCERTPHVAKAWRTAGAVVALSAVSTVELDRLRATAAPAHGCLSFSAALAALKDGHRVARAGWNGKGMWIALTKGGKTLTPSDLAETTGAAALLRAERRAQGLVDADFVPRCAHIDMRAADGSLVIGWLASQTDLLAEDWFVLEGP